MRNTASSDDIQSGISDSDKSVKTPLGKKILATFGILFIAIGGFSGGIRAFVPTDNASENDDCSKGQCRGGDNSSQYTDKSA